MIRELSAKQQLVLALLGSSLVGVLLFVYVAIQNHSMVYDYLLWNLFLAWLPFIIVGRLVYILKYKLWSSWEAIILSLLWLVFLPNSFYMITDFIHLETIPTNNVIYYAITFSSIIYTAVVLGLISLYLVHMELNKRFNKRWSAILVGAILASSSAAIYIGRDLRWNSWDILTNPGGIIFDISDRLIHVSDYPTLLATAGLFFVLLSSMYFLAWSGIRAIKHRSV